MELLFVAVIGAAIGALAYFTTRGRHNLGVIVLPFTGAIFAAVVWVGLTWLRWSWSGGWIWALAIAVPVVVCWGLALLIIRLRERKDAALFRRMTRPGT